MIFGWSCEIAQVSLKKSKTIQVITLKWQSCISHGCQKIVWHGQNKKSSFRHVEKVSNLPCKVLRMASVLNSILSLHFHHFVFNLHLFCRSCLHAACHWPMFVFTSSTTVLNSSSSSWTLLLDQKTKNKICFVFLRTMIKKSFKIS